MMRSIWMHPWDLEGTPPEAVITHLRAHGLNACHLAVAYHGGRMLVPAHTSRRVIEHPSGLYLPAAVAGRLQPQACGDGAAIGGFLRAAGREGLPVHAWVVLAHNDHLAAAHPECAVRNAFGDVYPYALCPSRNDVQEYFVNLCAAVAGAGGFAGLQLEALSFMGYAHGGLHDKRGVALPPVAEWLLSVCCCADCAAGYGVPGADLPALCRKAVDNCLEAGAAPDGDLAAGLRLALGEERLNAILDHRRAVILGLLERIRAACPGMPLSLRMAPSRLFTGGKAGLLLDDVAGRAEAACLTYFGASMERMREEVASLAARPAPLRIEGGFIFHGPDCRSRQDVAARLQLLVDGGMDGVILYSYGMAARRQWDWLAPSWEAGAL